MAKGIMAYVQNSKLWIFSYHNRQQLSFSESQQVVGQTEMQNVQ